MNTKSIFLALCCLTAFSSYAQHVPTLEEVVNGGLIVTKGESRVNWLSEGNSYSKKEKNPAGGYDIISRFWYIPIHGVSGGMIRAETIGY